MIVSDYFKRNLRLAVLVGKSPDKTPWKSEKTIKTKDVLTLAIKDLDYLRADLIAVYMTIPDKKYKELTKTLVDLTHEAGCIFLADGNVALGKQLLAKGFHRTKTSHLYCKNPGETPAEYGQAYIERWGDTDFMKNWKLVAENIFDHMPKGFNKEIVRVFDVGCLNAYMMESLRRVGAKHIYGTDISYEIAINRNVDPYHLPAITIGDFANNTYPNQFSDMTICMEVLEHLPPDSTDHFIEELGRVTSARGVLLISTSEDWEVDQTHTNCRKRDEWYRIFSKHGMVPYGNQMIFSGFNSFVFKKAQNPVVKLYYHAIHSLSLRIPLWGGLRLLKRTFARYSK